MNEPGSVLVVEDDPDLRLGLVDNLEDEGYAVHAASTVKEGWEALRQRTVDLVVLDLMLPDGDGYSLCRRIRQAKIPAAVLMLTARSLEDDLVLGFEAGADDYLTKPYRLRELLARVRALMRRPRKIEADDGDVRFGVFVLQRGPRTVQRSDGAEVPLTPTEFDLLRFLLDHVGQALPRRVILDEVWGRDVIVDGRTIDNFVSSLKRKLDWKPGCGFRIATVRGVGYRMDREPVEGADP